MKKLLCAFLAAVVACTAFVGCKRDPQGEEIDPNRTQLYVSVYGDPDKCDATFAALVGCAGFIRHELSVDFRDLRVVPQLTFIRDTSEAYSEKINAILEGLKKE